MGISTTSQGKGSHRGGGKEIKTDTECFRWFSVRARWPQCWIAEPKPMSTEVLRSQLSVRRNKAHAWITKFVGFFSYIVSESEEVWFDVRPKAVGKKRPCPIDELCSERSESSSALDETMARWYDAFETRVTASQSTHRSEWPGPLRNKASRERIQTFGCRPDVFRSNGSQLVHLWGLRSCQRSSSHNCRLSTVFSANLVDGCRTREANQ